METFLSDLRPYNKLFLGDFDSYTIIKYNIGKDQLMYKTKLGLLLFDKLLLPAAFFWQSEVMSNILPRIETLVEDGYIMPVIRDYKVTRDIKDYFERRYDETYSYTEMEIYNRPEFASEIAKDANKGDVNFLSKINTYVHLEERSTRTAFIISWIRDLEDLYDINSIRMIITAMNNDNDVITDEICSLLKKDIFSENFSRATVIEKVMKIIPNGQVRRKIEDRVTWLYLKSNAEVTSSSFYLTNNPYGGLVLQENLDLLIETLKIFGITKRMIEGLTLEELKIIKNSSEYILFINNYRELINNINVKQNDVVNDITKRTQFKIFSERIKTSMRKSLNTVNVVSSTIFLGLIVNYFSGSTINTDAFTAAGGLSLISNILKHIDKINMRMQNTSFIDFKKYIIAERYTEHLINSIGENRNG